MTGLGMGLTLLVILAVFKQFLLIGKPNEVLVFSGRTRKLADGSEVGYREILGGGWTWRWPIIEKVDRMKLTTIPIEIQTTNAYSAGGIPLNVHAVANINAGLERAARSDVRVWADKNARRETCRRVDVRGGVDDCAGGRGGGASGRGAGREASRHLAIAR